MAAHRPSFLIFIVDQMRADHMGRAGNRVIQTPNLDKLAVSGVHFQRAYVNCPLCMPSRSTLWTGLSPRGHRVRTNGIPLDPSIPTLPGALAEAGYRTASFGKIHLTNYTRRPDFPLEKMPPECFPELSDHWSSGAVESLPSPYYGFHTTEVTLGHGSRVGGDYALWLGREHPEQWERLMTTPLKPSPLGAQGCATFPLDSRFHHTAYTADRTIRFLSEQDGDHSFLAVCSFPDPHHPYHVPEPYDRMYKPEDVVPPVLREGELEDLAPFFKEIYERRLLLSGRVDPTQMSMEHRREILAYTYGMVSQIDHHLGRVLGALESKGLADNTVVVFISDHGDMMGDHGLLNKGPFHFEGLLRVPMIWRWPSRFKPRSCAGLASLLDFAPTVMDLAGVPAPEGLASAEAPKQPPAWPGRSLAPILRGDAESVQDSVLIENDEDYLGLRLRTLVTETHKITTYTGRRGAEPYGELFDFTGDPNELHNLWADSASSGLRRELIERLHHRLAETDIALPRRLSHA